MSAVLDAIVKFLASDQGQALIASILGLVGVYAARALAALRAKNAADTTQTALNVALVKAMNVVELVAPRVWKRLQPELQVDLQDGKIDAVEMARIEKIIEEELKGLMSTDGIQQLAKALGYEVPGFIAWIAVKVLSFIGVAQDPGDPSVPNAVATVHFATTGEESPSPPVPSQQSTASDSFPTGSLGG